MNYKHIVVIKMKLVFDRYGMDKGTEITVKFIVENRNQIKIF